MPRCPLKVWESITGRECGERFHEKCLGLIAELQSNINQKEKHKRFYPFAKDSYVSRSSPGGESCLSTQARHVIGMIQTLHNGVKNCIRSSLTCVVLTCMCQPVATNPKGSFGRAPDCFAVMLTCAHSVATAQELATQITENTGKSLVLNQA